MIITGRVIVSGLLALPKRAVNAITREAYADALIAWHDKRFPDRFRPDAAQRYHFKRRSARHIKRKRKQYGHTRPLEYSGAMRRMAESRFEVRTGRRRATGLIPMPRYAYALRRKGPNMREEMSTVLVKHQKEMRRHVLDHVVSALREAQAKRVLKA